MSQIHILDGQSNQGEILDYITAKNIIEDDHKKNKEDTLETYNFITFADKRFSEYLEKRNRLIIPDEDDTLREFVIFEAVKYKDSEGHKAQVFAHASYLELKKASILKPSTFEGTASQHGGRALNDTGWQIGIVEGKGTRKLTIENHTNPYEMLKRIAREFELELRFRVEHDGNKITGRYVDLLERIGEWRGREVEFGKDLVGIRRIEKQDIVTALLGLGPEDEDGNRLEVLVEDEEALQRWGRVDEHGKLHHLIEPYEIQSTRSEMTEEEARQYTRTALNKRINTQVTYEGSFVDLENVPGMQNKKIRFGDTIRIKDTEFNPPLYLEARIFEQTRSIKTKAKKDFKLGDYIEYSEEEVNAIWQQLQKDIRNRVSRYEMMEYTYDKITIDDKDETVFKDGKTFAEATGIKAEKNAKEFAVEEDKKIKVDVEDYADTVAEQQGESALSQAKMYAVSKEVYDNQMVQIANDIEDRAPLEYVDGEFRVIKDDLDKFDAEIEKKADGSTVYTISEVDNMINNTVSVTEYETDKDGIVKDLNSHGTRIGQNEKAIGLKADSSELDAVNNSLTKKIGNVEVTAEGAKMSASEVKADLDGLEVGGRNLLQESTSSNLIPSSGGKLTNYNDSWSYWAKVESNKTYTISRSNDNNNRFRIVYLDKEPVSGIEYLSIRTRDSYLEDTFTTSSDVTHVLIYLQYNEPVSGDKPNIQLEKGNKATDWSPAPEDVEGHIDQVSGRVETLDASVETLAGEVSLKASKSVVDSLEERVENNESELNVLPGQIKLKADASDVYSKGQVDATFDAVNKEINMKVDDGEARSIFLQEANSFTFDADQVNFTGHVFGKGATFDGDITGAKITGSELVGATGTFSGEIQAAQLVVDNPNLGEEGATGLKLELAINREVLPNPYKKTGYAVFRSEHDGMLIFKENLNEKITQLDFFNVETKRFLINGRVEVGLDGKGGSDYGLRFPKLHSIAASPSDGHFSFYGNRASGQRPFHIRSHVNEQSGAGNNSYRDDMFIGGSSGALYIPQTYSETSSNAANVRIGASGQLYRTSSARKYKMLEESIKVDPYNIHKLQPKDWYDKPEVERLANAMNLEYKGLESDPDIAITGAKRIAGLVAEDVEDAGLEMYVEYNKDGEIEGLQYDRLWTLLIPISKDHEVTLTDHEKRIAYLEKKVETQQEEINQLKGVA